MAEYTVTVGDIMNRVSVYFRYEGSTVSMSVDEVALVDAIADYLSTLNPEADITRTKSSFTIESI